MGKTVVLSCELDGDFDSADNRVVTASVCGHRIELCKKHRVQLLTMVGVSVEHAVAYCDAFDQQVGNKGANPSMAQVVEEWEALQALAPVVAEPAEVPQEALVEAAAEEETEAEPAPGKRRR